MATSALVQPKKFNLNQVQHEKWTALITNQTAFDFKNLSVKTKDKKSFGMEYKCCGYNFIHIQVNLLFYVSVNDVSVYLI